MNKHKKSKVTEIVLLSVFGTVWVFGFILAILGVVAFNLPSLTINNPLYSAQKNLGKFLNINGIVDFRLLGSAILLVAMVFLIITIYHYANKYDQIKAKKARKEERLKSILKDAESTSDSKSESQN